MQTCSGFFSKRRQDFRIVTTLEMSTRCLIDSSTYHAVVTSLMI